MNDRKKSVSLLSETSHFDHISRGIGDKKAKYLKCTATG
jgi:hypothetical protein